MTEVEVIDFVATDAGADQFVVMVFVGTLEHVAQYVYIAIVMHGGLCDGVAKEDNAYGLFFLHGSEWGEGEKGEDSVEKFLHGAKIEQKSEDRYLSWVKNTLW